MRIIRKRRRKKQDKIKKYKVNHQIKASEVRVVDEQGKMLGVFSLSDALKLAEEKELDLIEVDPKAAPPVCRLMEWGKFKYKLEKEEKSKKKKKQELKGVRISMRISSHDREVKLNQVKKFLEQGNKVRIELRLKGRERLFENEAKAHLKNFVEDLSEFGNIDQDMTKSSAGFSIILKPKKI